MDECRNVAVHDCLDIACLHPRPKILHHLVRLEDVAPNLASKSDIRFLAVSRGNICGSFVCLHLLKLRLKHTHRSHLVLLLTALVLTCCDNAARYVPDPHCRLDLVDVLTAFTSAPIGIDLE